MPGLKVCSKCKIQKPVEAFGKNKSRSDGLYHYCKTCSTAATAGYRARNPEKSRLTAAAYREKNPEKARAAQAAWREAHPERQRASSTAWREANADKVRADHLAWSAANREKRRRWNKIWYENNREHIIAKTVAWTRANPGKHNAATKLRKQTLKQHTPVWADTQAIEVVYVKAAEWGFDVDHVVPLRGKTVCGLHVWANLQLLDRKLNRSKSNRVWPDMP